MEKNNENEVEAYLIDDEEVKKVLDELENDILVNEGLSQLSGGFAHAEIFDYDDDYFDVEIKFGIQDGEENVVYTEQVKINRFNLTIED